MPLDAVATRVLVATCLLPPAAVALERTLAEDPDVEVEAERVAAHSTGWTMPGLCVTSSDLDRTAELLGADPTVERVVEAEHFDGEARYYVEWATAVQDRIDAFLDEQATILRASADANGWKLRIRFASRSQFDSFRTYLDDAGHSFRLRHLSEAGEAHQPVGGLTPEQREVLRTAIEAGYFRVPREVTTRELAAELDRSHQSVSELLRRGTENLVAGMLAEERESPGEPDAEGDG